MQSCLLILPEYEIEYTQTHQQDKPSTRDKIPRNMRRRRMRIVAFPGQLSEIFDTWLRAEIAIGICWKKESLGILRRKMAFRILS